jgi:pseudaminic acid synthase
MKNKKIIKIGKNRIGAGRAFIVAEISANHRGDINIAKKLIFEAKKAGADAVKIQTYTAGSITLKSDKKDFLINRKAGKAWISYNNLYDLYLEGQTPNEWHPELFKYAKKLKIDIFSSPFDEKAVDFLENLGCVAYKIASPEINHFPLLKKVAETKKPIIISSGVSYLKDITDAVNYLKKNGCNKICILKCDSNYPSSLKVSNLSSIQYLKKKFGVPVGFSDHTIGNEAALISILFGACLVEKHFNIKRNKSLDDFFSSNEDEFKNMVNSIRILENDIKKNKYFISNTAISNRSSMRSIYISKNVKKNEIVTNENIRIVRPGFGMHPKFYFKVLGKRFKKKYNYGDRLSKDKLK